MAQTKTDYGLIYNTDGSVCTTVRPDQTPFVGVNSFAVETATTNYVTINNYWLKAYDGTLNATPIEYKGKSALKVEVEAIGGTSRPRIIFRSPITIHTDEIYAISCYIENNNRVITTTDIEINMGLEDGSGLQNITPISISNNRVVTIKPILEQYAGNTNCTMLVVFATVGTYYVYYPQLEKKPFASSFTVGSRPRGRLVIPVEDLKFNIANDDWVISYWKYPVATHDDTQNGYNTCSLGRPSKGYILWGKHININKYRLYIVLNDATEIRNISNNTFNPTDYFYHWHYEVMKKQGKVLSYYVDGVKQIEYTIPADKELQTPFDVGLSLGGYIWSNTFLPNNALIANVGNGKLKPGEFTDEHIMAIYEANRAFAQKGGVKIY